MEPNDTAERIALATRVLFEYSSHRPDRVSPDDVRELQLLAVNPAEQAMDLDELARNVIEREVKRLKRSDRASAAQ